MAFFLQLALVHPTPIWVAMAGGGGGGGGGSDSVAVLGPDVVGGVNHVAQGAEHLRPRAGLESAVGVADQLLLGEHLDEAWRWVIGVSGCVGGQRISDFDFFF